MRRILLHFFLLFTSISFAKIKVGVTMLPYYCYVSNIVGDKMEVVPLVPENINTHSYDATPKDVKKLASVDVVVINGIGNDEYVYPMLRAAKKTNPNIKVINANETANLLYISGQKNSKINNVHTYISITQSIKQIDYIAQKLGEIDPANKEFYLKNSREYAKKLRKLKADALNEVKKLGNIDIRVATLHGGYDYLLSEFGIDVKAVIEPSHGAQPSAADLEKVIKIIKNEKIDIIFGEKNFNNKFVDTIHKETGVEVRSLSHMTNGAYEPDSFEKFIKVDLDEVVKAIKDVAAKKGKK